MINAFNIVRESSRTRIINSSNFQQRNTTNLKNWVERRRRRRSFDAGANGDVVVKIEGEGEEADIEVDGVIGRRDLNQNLIHIHPQHVECSPQNPTHVGDGAQAQLPSNLLIVVCPVIEHQVAGFIQMQLELAVGRELVAHRIRKQPARQPVLREDFIEEPRRRSCCFWGGGRAEVDEREDEEEEREELHFG